MLMNDFPSFNLFVLSLVFNTVNLSTAMENFTKNHKVIEKFWQLYSVNCEELHS